MDCRYLNRVAQELEPYQEAVSRFEGLPVVDQCSVLGLLEFMAHQAGATATDSSIALVAVRLSKDFRPAWIPDGSLVCSRANYKVLDPADLPYQYQYLMRLFAVADARRRKQCGSRCGHWWHHLGPPGTSNRILSG